MWSLQAARNSFSALVTAALEGRPQYVSRRGRIAVVVISAEDYARLAAASGTQRSFVAHLLDQPERADPPPAQVEARDVAF